MICFYHNADNDGFCSGAIVKSIYPDCVLWGINYGQKVPWDEVNKHDKVVIVDFSFTPSEMSKLNEGDLIWIDHHKTAIEALSNQEIKGLREIGRAACELTWEFFKTDPMPIGVKLVGRYDVWDHSDPRTISFELGLKQYVLDPVKNLGIWNDVINADEFFVYDVCRDGEVIKSYEAKSNISKNETLAFTAELAGIKVIAANNLCNSRFFDSTFDPNYHDAMCAFYLGKKGAWKYSLYSPKIDCSVIAQQFGGGGHAGAAGFVHKNYLLRRLDD